MANADIPVFLAYVRSEFLYAHKEGNGYFTPCTVFAISSHAGENLTFQILADDKTHVASIPISAIASRKTAPKIDEGDCVYSGCQSDDVVVNQHEYLSTLAACGVWNRDGSFWMHGSYMFTVEWSNRASLHLIELEDGNYVLWPSDRLTWSDADELPQYGSME